MLPKNKTAAQIRKEFKLKLSSGKCLRFVGAFSALISRMIENKGFDGVYISGAVLSSDRAWPDVGLTTMTEVLLRAEGIAEGCSLPSLVDVDTGFGESMNCARAVMEAEKRGLSALHIEDQVFPKRCGHLDHKKIISEEHMISKIRAAVQARRDQNFLIIARTDAKSVYGMEEAVKRARSYAEAGADVIFPEALFNIKEFEQFRSQLKTPLLANMTEFGKTEIISHKEFEQIGYNMMIYPVSTWRIALKAVEQGLEQLFQDQQSKLLSKMLTRQRLYEIIQYDDYKQFDSDVFNFKVDEEST